MKKLLAYILSIVISVSCMPCAIAQAAPVFKPDRSYSVYLNDQEIELSQYKDKQEDTNHKVIVPTDTERIIVKKGDAGFPAVIACNNGNAIVDNDELIDEFWLTPWENASYDSSSKCYVVPVKDLENECQLVLMDSNGKTSYLYICKEDIVVTAPETDVINAIAALPTPVTLEDKEAVEAARTAYDALDEAVKANVTNYSDLVIAEKTIEVLEAKAELEQAKSDYNALKTEADQAKSDLEKAQTDLATAKTDLETANTQLETAKSELETAKTDAAATKTELETAKTDLETAQNELVIAKTELETAQTATATAKTELETAKTELETAQTQLEAAKEEAAAAKTALAKEKAKNRTVAGLKLASKSKKITVTWKKTSGATGYQVSYKLKTAKSYTVLKTTTSLKAVTKTLKSGKVYQFKVRTYTTVSGAKVYGKWTSVKSITCK